MIQLEINTLKVKQKELPASSVSMRCFGVGELIENITKDNIITHIEFHDNRIDFYVETK